MLVVIFLLSGFCRSFCCCFIGFGCFFVGLSFLLGLTAQSFLLLGYGDFFFASETWNTKGPTNIRSVQKDVWFQELTFFPKNIKTNHPRVVMT